LNSETIHTILKQYWGYSTFRSLQEDIVLSVLNKNETLALLPTGGGKSVCFQVPALAMEGVCIVISPLIALMKDQVEQLKKRGIVAAAIYTGMHKREIEIQLDNCIYGNTKFLYVSPERLLLEDFTDKVSRMNVCLLAIDEAHCISQWGYDFRPPYLEIANFRNFLPENTPVIALTATATLQVRTDICNRLNFKNPKIFTKSFSRKNLSYSAFKLENKNEKLVEILQKVQGTAVVYVRSRKKAKETADFLLKNNINADFYHAGLENKTRSIKQDNWINNKTRVIVATNAFGMGIDKPDVRLVVHIELPDTLEAYYQEAGRGGRDELNAYAVVLYSNFDISQLQERTLQAHPEISEIKKTYQALANYFQLAVGSGYLAHFEFDINHFCQMFSLNVFKTYQCLKKIESEGFIQFNESFYRPSRLFIDLSPQKLYEYQLAYPKADTFIKLILRMYGGEIYTNFIKIDEKRISKEMNWEEKKVKEMLQSLHKQHIIIYEPQTEKPHITFTTARFDSSKLPINVEKIETLKKQAIEKTSSVINYLESENRCRTQMLLDYFGEISDEKCGFCDFCIKQKKVLNTDTLALENSILEKIKEQNISPSELVNSFKITMKERVLSIVKNMLEQGRIKINNEGKIIF
jgi:ATP-dependent DNA helicase RecQ